jgi:cell division protein FtsI (penicillin-binding protein 3)
MARYLKLSVDDAHDTTSVVIPDVKNGDIVAANMVLRELGIKTEGGWNGEIATGNTVWGHTVRNNQSVTLSPTKIASNVMPDLTGMGARDAVYLMESKGMKVKLIGRGRVRSQSPGYGNDLKPGTLCTLTLN